MINNQKDLKKERLSEALRENLKKRKEFFSWFDLYVLVSEQRA